MDQYFFNHLCVNDWLGLKSKSKQLIKAHFKRYEWIKWHQISIEKAYYGIDENLILPFERNPCPILMKYHEVLKDYNQKGIFFAKENDFDFPHDFLHLDPGCDLIYGMGNRTLMNTEKAIAIVGSRKPTAYGRRVAHDLSRHLAGHGVLVVSGLALGVDAIAHASALEAGGDTLGILASGIKAPYPQTNVGLFQKIIASGGLILSEQGGSQSPQKYHFPLRNRLISAFSKVVVLIEAGEKSGTLTTAKHALDQGKSIFALPGSIYSEESRGSNRLISEGAMPLIRFDDVLEQAGIEKQSQAKRPPTKLEGLSDLSKKIYNLLLTGITLSVDDVVNAEKCENSDVVASFTELVFEDICQYVSINEIQIL